MTNEDTIKDAWRRAQGWPETLEVLRVYPKIEASVALESAEIPAFRRDEVVLFSREYMDRAVRVVGRYRDAKVIVAEI